LTDEGIERLVWGITGEKPKKSNRSGNRKIGDAAAESIAADMRRWYSKHVGRTWDARWSDADADADTNQPEKLPPFIDSQGMRLLSELEDPRPYLRAEHFRAGRVARGGGNTTGQMPDAWMAVDRFEVAHNSLAAEDGKNWDLSRLVLTTDAGVGKTTTMEWLEVELNRGSSDRLAMLLTFRDLRNISGDGWADGLLPLLVRRVIARGSAGGRAAKPDWRCGLASVPHRRQRPASCLAAPLGRSVRRPGPPPLAVRAGGRIRRIPAAAVSGADRGG
jgi:hypothetical protein